METINSILIKADGMVSNVYPMNGTDFTLEELQDFVGGYIEIAELRCADTTYPLDTIVVNEDGLSLGLTFNPVASALFGYAGVVGDVLITSKHLIK